MDQSVTIQRRFWITAHSALRKARFSSTATLTKNTMRIEASSHGLELLKMVLPAHAFIDTSTPPTVSRNGWQP
jgi:hypothetical protein